MGDSRIAPWLAAGVLTGIVGSARAGNSGHSPTPVQWEAGACLTVVDRARDPVVEFAYAIPFEDTEVTTDEVADSRTHQFFAVCESTGWFVFLPRWVSAADVDAAAARGLVDADALDLDELLETSARWDGCWSRITTDDQRRRITFEAAGEVVRWDTSQLPAGVYVVEGYTHEPPKNQWRTKPGVFKLIDTGSPDGAAPAVAVTNPETIVYADEAATIEGCVDAGQGATLTAAWATVDQTMAWEIFAGPERVDDGTFALPFLPPEAAIGTTVAIRVTVDDAVGRSSFAYMLEPLIVLSDNGPHGGSTGTDSGSDDGATPGADEHDPDRGCVCTTTGSPGPEVWVLLVAAALGLRRRRPRGHCRFRGG